MQSHFSRDRQETYVTGKKLTKKRRQRGLVSDISALRLILTSNCRQSHSSLPFPCLALPCLISNLYFRTLCNGHCALSVCTVEYGTVQCSRSFIAARRGGRGRVEGERYNGVCGVRRDEMRREGGWVGGWVKRRRRCFRSFSACVCARPCDY